MNKTEARERLDKVINDEIDGLGVNGELGIEDLVDYALKAFDFNDNNSAYVALQKIKQELALQREKRINHE
ncbi:MAG: hypothetical protein [Caudovirales sp. ctOwN3]|nr:MAG: hypothetical protein [Caudovirales sp. ctOwN3]